MLQPDAPNGDLKDGRPDLDLLVGITSYGLGSCTDADLNLGIYTNVGHFSEWIQSVISNATVVSALDTTQLLCMFLLPFRSTRGTKLRPKLVTVLK